MPVDSALSTWTSVSSPVSWSTWSTRMLPSLTMSPAPEQLTLTLLVWPGSRSTTVSTLYGVSSWNAFGCDAGPAPAIGFATTRTVSVREAPGARSPRLHETSPADWVQGIDAESKVTPAGSWSRTTTPVAVSRPMFSTSSV
jgi:hypothetical protein